MFCGVSLGSHADISYCLCYLIKNGPWTVQIANSGIIVSRYKFAMRIVLLLFGAWVTLLAFNSTLVLLPVSLGRAIFASFSQLPITRGAKCNGETPILIVSSLYVSHVPDGFEY
jgi:hypothetical protein